MACKVRQAPANPNRWYFDFDAAAPGGGGGASVLLDLLRQFASIDSVHKNILVPQRSTGGLLADGLRQVGIRQPVIIEGYNVDRSTRAHLQRGANGQGSRTGHLLENLVRELGGTITKWQPVPDGSIWHLWVYVTYPGVGP